MLVPAGIVLKDPLTLIDPVLFPRDRIASLRPLPYPTAPAEDRADILVLVARANITSLRPHPGPRTEDHRHMTKIKHNTGPGRRSARAARGRARPSAARKTAATSRDARAEREAPYRCLYLGRRPSRRVRSRGCGICRQDAGSVRAALSIGWRS